MKKKQIMSSLRYCIWGQTGCLINNQVWGQFKNQVQFRDPVWDQIKKQAFKNVKRVDQSTKLS